MPPFVHLRLHTEFSVSDSIVRIDNDGPADFIDYHAWMSQ